jgi:hypothetical protein
VTASLDGLAVRVALGPVPRITVKRLSVDVVKNNQSDNLDRDVSAQVYTIAIPAIIEYQEVNNIPGFQPGEDTFVKNVSLIGSPNTFWNPFGSVTKTIDSATGSEVYSLSACRKDDLLCLTLKASNGSFSENGKTYFPDNVKVDIQVGTFSPSLFQPNANNRIGLVGMLLYSSDVSSVEDNTASVDKAVDQAKSTNGVATVPPDVILNYANIEKKGYLNFERTMTATLQSNSAKEENIVVNRTLLSKFRADRIFAKLRDHLNESDSQIGDFSSDYTVFVWGIDRKVEGVSYFLWDPELGVDSVVTSLNSAPLYSSIFASFALISALVLFFLL